jgi:hypothetical protein
MEAFAERLEIPRLIDEGYGCASAVRAQWVAAASFRAAVMRDQDAAATADHRDWVPPKLKSEADQHAEVRDYLRAVAAGENPDTPEHLLKADAEAKKMPPAAAVTTRRVVTVPTFKRR